MLIKKNGFDIVFIVSFQEQERIFTCCWFSLSPNPFLFHVPMFRFYLLASSASHVAVFKTRFIKLSLKERGGFELNQKEKDVGGKREMLIYSPEHET